MACAPPARIWLNATLRRESSARDLRGARTCTAAPDPDPALRATFSRMDEGIGPRGSMAPNAFDPDKACAIRVPVPSQRKFVRSVTDSIFQLAFRGRPLRDMSAAVDRCRCLL